MNFDTSSGIIGKLIQVGVILGGLVVAVIIGRMVAQENYHTLAFLLAIAVGFVIYFLFSKYFWMICFGSIFLQGGLTFLPLGFNLFEVFLLVGVGHFVVDQVVLKKNFPRVGVAPDGQMLCLAMAVVLFHASSDRFGVRMLGSETWGGRAYLSILAGAMGYFCLQALYLNPKIWSRLPALIMTLAFVELGIRLATALSPRLGDLVGKFYSGVYQEVLGQTFSRWGFLGNFGYAALTTSLVLSTIPGLFFRGKLIPPVLFTAGLLGCLTSGYRSTLMLGGVIILIACIRDLRWKTAVGILLAFLFLIGIAIVHSGIYRLPPGIQRGLVWLPGDWDSDIVQSAAGSDDFRWRIWDYWSRYYFPKHPIIGRGMGIPYDDVLKTLPIASSVDPETGQTLYKMADESDSFAIMGNLHNGFLSVLDRFGVVGGLFIWAFTLVGLSRFIKFMLRDPGLKKNPALHWIALYGSAWIICYSPGALRIDDFLGVMIVMLGIFNSLSRSIALDEKAEEKRLNAPVPDLTALVPEPNRFAGLRR